MQQYKKTFIFNLILWICIIGLSKIPYIFYLLYENQPENITFDSFSDQLQFYSLFLGGVAVGILSFIRFDYLRSRKIMILIAELSFSVGIILIRQDLDSVEYWQIALGISASISSVIYPLFLCEMSFNSDKQSLCNYLQFSGFIGVGFIKLMLYLPHPGYWVYPFQVFISLVNGILINFGLPFSSTLAVYFMKGEKDKAYSLLQKLVKPAYIQKAKEVFEDMRSRKWFILPGQNEDPRLLVDEKISIDFEEEQKTKNKQILLLSFLIPLTHIYYYEYIFEKSLYFFGSPGDLNQIEATVGISLLVCVKAFFACKRFKHDFLFKIGFQITFIVAVISLIEQNILDDEQYNNKFLDTIQFLMYNILSMFINQWKVYTFSNLTPNLIWLHSLIYWISFTVSFLSTSQTVQIGYSLAVGSIGFILSQFLY